ncbi:AMP-binding protein [uncultured Methylovirgula sp.]|uniref:AMP-binding protein n=1 Tax=uncultured Methylovirgula sp. TaxID=1285960 RepID=UPI002623D6EC|nr:AMP-binding protein [uncultured Methylovirgula sp.]
MPATEAQTLRQGLAAGAADTRRMLWGLNDAVALADLLDGTVLDQADIAGRSIVLTTHDQLAAAQALVALDGTARRIVLCPPDLPLTYLAAIAADAEADAIVTDREETDFAGHDLPPRMACKGPLQPSQAAAPIVTEWVLLTSGTTGVPKMVVHSLAALTGAIRPPRAGDAPPIWATFYDIRRYGGLQILLRALFGNGSMILSETGEPVSDHLHRLAARGVTHISGTPSHWRRALMSSDCNAIAPHYVRLSGEIADQTILDALKRQYPRAAIGHAYASTEAGVGFEVNDGLEGFPASLLRSDGDPAFKVVDGTLRIRSRRTASRYLGSVSQALTDEDGFIDSGDFVTERNGRCYFVGRRGGVINVGGLKVHPEEVEQVINRHAAVKMSLVSARRNPITGAIVVADVVLHDPALLGEASDALKQDILAFCRAALPVHKVPAAVKFVPSLEMTPAGKLVRQNA